MGVNLDKISSTPPSTSTIEVEFLKRVLAYTTPNIGKKNCSLFRIPDELYREVFTYLDGLGELPDLNGNI